MTAHRTVTRPASTASRTPTPSTAPVVRAPARTPAPEPPSTRTSPDWRPRTPDELAAAQLRSIARFHEARRAAEQAAATASRSRELRMDAARTLQVLRREHEALIARADEQLRLSCELLRSSPSRRVVLAHRGEWFAGSVGRLLRDEGWEIVAALDNGADAVGVAVAEQPDALLVEDTLAMLPGEQVVREVRALCPGTVVVAQVAHSGRMGALLEAGATSVFCRQVRPAEVVRGLDELVPA